MTQSTHQAHTTKPAELDARGASRGGGAGAAIGRIVGRAMQAKSCGDGRPFIVGHHLTGRCMCACKSCLWRDNDCQDVPLADLKRFYAEAADAGFVATALTGGEPMLRRDLGELVRFIKEQAAMSILLFTTGWLLEKRMDEVLPHIDMMVVSVDSADPARHDTIRGLGGLFARMEQGVRAARSRYPALPIQLNCCVQRGVEDEIDALIALARTLDVRISFDVITEARHGGDGPAPQTDMGLTPATLEKLAAELLDCKRAGAPIVNSERYFAYFARGRPGYRCHLPKLVMFVDGAGNAECCLDLSRPLGNIRRDSLEAIMARPRFRALRTQAEACCSCSSPTMVDLSQVWENPSLVFASGGLTLG